MKRIILLFIACMSLFSCECLQLMSYKEWLEKSEQKIAVCACGIVTGAPCYWKNNNKPVYLEDANSANSIYVYENDVYVAGLDSLNTCYWKNGKKISGKHLYCWPI